MEQSNLSQFTKTGYSPDASFIKRGLWYFINICFFCSRWCVFNNFRIFLLRVFGAKIGKGVYIKPAVNIKHPWKLIIGDYTWIGEKVWIDNLETINIGNHVCVSQGALLLTGNHDYSISSFNYRNAPITLENGVWIGAQSVVCSGVTAQSHAVLTVGSVAAKDLEAYTIYQGNPAIATRKRRIK